MIRGEHEELARHARGTRERQIIDPSHYDGLSTDRVERPTPLGRRGRLQVAGLSSGAASSLLLLPASERIARPLDEYVRLVEALR